MDKKKLTRLMIDTVVSKGIENMADDPKRTIRKLADMGQQVSTGRFQEDIIDIIQTILADDNSPYYTMLQNFLDNTDHDTIRTFGINMGYNSWTYDARILRSKSEELGVYLPWILIFRFDADSDKGTTPVFIKKAIEQALSYGINSFCIMQKGGLIASDELIEMFKEYEECGFFYFLEDSEITAGQLSAIKECKNVLLSINADEPQSGNTSKLLHDAKIMYSIHHFYDDNDFAYVDSIDANSESLKKYFDYKTGMIFLLPKDGCANHGDIVKQIRLEGKFPCFLWDLYHDSSLVSKHLVGQDNVFIEFDADGFVLKPSCEDANLNITKMPLIEIIRYVMPDFSCALQD